MWNVMALAVAAAVVLAEPGPAVAGPASEELFRADVLDGIAAKTEIGYAHDRMVLRTEGLRPVEGGTAMVVLGTADDGIRAAQVRMGSGEALRVVGTFPASSGNPLLPIMLESSARAMSTITGGSPFYIRNRMKEALAAADQVNDITIEVGGAEVAAREIILRPFLNDAKRDRMGNFAEMTLRFVMAEAATGGFVLFEADTPPAADGIVAYRETFMLHDTRMGE